MNKLLNKITTTNNGYVALFSTGFTQMEIEELSREFTLGETQPLMEACTVNLKVKCPLFVQLQFAQFGLQTISKRRQGRPEAYIPEVNDICAKDLESSEAIHEDFKRTTEALLINPKAYQYEGCDRFISQVMSPISVYNELIVSGSLSRWIKFIHQSNLPSPIEAYRKHIEDVIAAEFGFLREQIIRDGKTKR